VLTLKRWGIAAGRESGPYGGGIFILPAGKPPEEKMKEEIISNLNDLFILIQENTDKGLYFRGEYTNNETTASLPQVYRKCSGYNSDEKNREWFTDALGSLGVGAPYNFIRAPHAAIKEGLMNTPEWSWQKWDTTKLEALMTHYLPDFNALNEVLPCSYPDQTNIPFKSSYLDITSDIIAALHFACSEFEFRPKKEVEKFTAQQLSECGNGYIFIYDPQEIEKSAKYLQLVSHSSYAYFYKKKEEGKEEEYLYQPFDRITHQRGAFLSPKRDKDGTICCEIFKKEIQEIYVQKRILLTGTVKQELFHLFGDVRGLNYYFPKIPCIYSQDNDVQKAYADLEGITLLK
jgi:hypothetical protein